MNDYSVHNVQIYMMKGTTMRHRGLLLVLMMVLISAVAQAQELSGLDSPQYLIPENERLQPSNSILYRRNYQQVHGAVDIYDAPNGNIVISRPAGTYFVSVGQSQDGWTQINEAEWVRSDILSPAPISYLGGVFLDDMSSDHPLGLLHHSVYIRDTAGAETYDERNVLQEYSLVYLLDEVVIDDKEWLQVGENAWIPGAYVARITPIARPAEVDSERWVGVDTAEQVLVAYDGSTPVFATLVSTGHEETPTFDGLYTTYVRFNARAMSRGNPSQPWFYYMEDVPYTFYFNENQALHGAYWHNNFGTRQSHGCVNMSLTDSYWVYSWLSENLDVTDDSAVWPQVFVYSE